MGISKVFFKSGVVADLEERRDLKLGTLISGFQAICRGFFGRRGYRREHGQEDAIRVIQRNARVFITLNQWSWWKLYRQVKPLLSVHRQEQEEKALKDKKRAALEILKGNLVNERDSLSADLQAQKDALDETIASLKRTEEARKNYKF